MEQLIVPARMAGTVGDIEMQLVLDTGANVTAIDERLLTRAGYGPDRSVDTLNLITGGGVLQVPVFRVSRLTMLDVTRNELLVTGLSFPEESGIDGVLGLDFFRGHRLTIDLREGWIGVE